MARIHCPWTLALCAVLVVLNAGVLPGTPEVCKDWLKLLEYDGQLIRQGEWWRMLTGNLVHFSRMHFLLDVGVFLVLGLLYEPYLKRAYPWLLLTMSAVIGVACLAVMDERTRMRGLSGVDTGLFAAAVIIEIGLATNDKVRWLWAGPAAALLVYRTIYETITGQSVFSTQTLLGPMKLATEAHLAGIVAAIAFMLLRWAIGVWIRPCRKTLENPNA